MLKKNIIVIIKLDTIEYEGGNFMKHYFRSFFVNYLSGLILNKMLIYSSILINGEYNSLGNNYTPPTKDLVTGLTVYLFIVIIAMSINVHYYRVKQNQKYQAIFIFVFGLIVFGLGIISPRYGIDLPDFFNF